MKRCKRCHHSEAYAGPLLGDICGSCGDDLRQEAEAERMADLFDYEQELFNAREEAAYNTKEETPN